MERLSHPVICFGEVLWDILPSRSVPGGAPLNVAYHLKKLGINPAVISRIGHDDYGKGLINLLSESGMTTEYFDVDYDHPTGLVYANLNDQHEVIYDISYPSSWDFIEWKDEYVTLTESATYFLYGSLASRNKTSRNTLEQLLEIGKTKVLDINLRPPHFYRTQVEFLLQQANIVKMNIAELELITGWFSKFTSTEDRIKLIQDRFKIDTVIITMGGDGAVVNDKGKLHRHPGFKVTVADTIGSGDAFLSGFLYQLLNGSSVEDALAFASGMGAFIATQAGACPDYEISQVTNLVTSNSFKSIALT